MRNRYFKKICSYVLIIALVFGIIPNTVSAEETTTNSSTDEVKTSIKNSESTTNEEPQESLTVISELVDKREEKVKHFLMSDRSIQAVMYSEPVHYYEDGKWKDIDVSLNYEGAKDEQDFNGYTNKKGNFSVKIAKNDSQDNLARIKKDKYELKFKLINENDNLGQMIHEAKINQHDENTLNGLSADNKNTYTQAYQVDTVSDSIVYEGIADMDA